MAIDHRTYAELVTADDDLIGHVAYALYKRDKLKFCDSVEKKHNRAATEDELAIFIQSANLDTRLQGYKTQAESLLERLGEYQLEEALKTMRSEFDGELNRRLSESKSWRRVAAEALFGSIVTALMWAGIVLVGYTSRVGPSQMMNHVFGINIGTTQVETQPSQ